MMHLENGVYLPWCLFSSKLFEITQSNLSGRLFRTKYSLIHILMIIFTSKEIDIRVIETSRSSIRAIIANNGAQFGQF